MKRKLVAWILGIALLFLMGAECADGAPECKVGSLKAEKGKLYHCKDYGDGNGPHWVKE